MKEYVEGIEIAGDISPTCYALFWKRQKELDVTDKSIRLIVAVHYFSLKY